MCVISKGSRTEPLHFTRPPPPSAEGRCDVTQQTLCDVTNKFSMVVEVTSNLLIAIGQLERARMCFN